MTASVQPAARPGAWRLAVIILVAVLAVGIGTAAGAFLLGDQGTGTDGAAASYVPGDAIFYAEFRVQPSGEQDAALRELIGRFPAIEGLDLERPLYDQLGEVVDEQLGAQDEIDLSWAEDVAPWFDGGIALAVTDLPLEAMSGERDPSAVPPVPGMVMVLGVTDADAARSAVSRLLEEGRADGVEYTTIEHRGVEITQMADTDGAVAVTEDAVLVAPDAGGIVSALDVHAQPQTGIGDSDEMRELVAQLPTDWLAFMTFDMGDVMAAAFAEAEESGGGASVAVFRDLFEHLPMRGAVAVTAGGDRIAVDGATEPPSGPFAVENADRGLAGEVPADTLYFADGGNIGAAMAAVIAGVKDAAAMEPTASQQIGMAESVLGAELEELVAWIGDGALAAGFDGEQPWAGLVLVPNDVEAAERRLDQLATFAALAASDGASGVSVERSEVAGEQVTTIRWEDSNAMPPPGMPMPTGVAVQYVVSGDRALIGIGERFVPAVLELGEADSLSANDRYAATIAELGGTTNAGSQWLDLAGAREAIMAAIGPMMASMDPDGAYESTVEPWLLPLDRYAAVSLLEGEVLVQRAGLFVE